MEGDLRLREQFLYGNLNDIFCLVQDMGRSRANERMRRILHFSRTGVTIHPRQQHTIQVRGLNF